MLAALGCEQDIARLRTVRRLIELERQLGRPVHAAIVRERDLLRALDRIYLRQAQIAGLAEELGQEIAEASVDEVDWNDADDSDAPVSRLLN